MSGTQKRERGIGIRSQAYLRIAPLWKREDVKNVTRKDIFIHTPGIGEHQVMRVVDEQQT